MKAWIKKNGVFLIVLAIICGLLYSAVEGIVGEINYKKQIRSKDKEIAELKQDMKREEEKARAAIEEARTAEEEARLERVEKEKHKANEARLEEEKKGLRAKIAALPPTQVVVHTVEILKVEPQEITLREQGVLFTLSAARTNLEFLEEFTLVKKQHGELQISLARSEASGAKLLEAGAKKDIAIASQKKQIDKWPEIELRWQDKFDLSENRRKKARAKGRKEGAVVATIVIIAVFFLGK